MRNTIIGIVIGLVVGVMVGATLVAPGLIDARRDEANLKPSQSVPGDQPLSIKDVTDATGQSGKTGQTDQNGIYEDLRPSSAVAAQDAAATRQLRIISFIAPKAPILGEVSTHFQRNVSASSAGRLKVSLFAPGALVDKQDSFDAARSATVDAVFAKASQWADDAPALDLFTSIPFGPDASEYLAWYYHGGGRELFQDLFKRRGMHPILCGATPPQGGGWYRKAVRKAEDLHGLTISTRGLGARVLQKLGAITKDLEPGQVMAAFEQGQLDGAHHALPSVDAKLGFNRFAHNAYFPAWQSSLTLYTLAINAKVWARLSPSARATLESACGDNMRFSLSRTQAAQFDALKNLGLAGVQVRRWPDQVLGALNAAWKETSRELVQADNDFNTVWSSLHLFRRDFAIWRELSRP